MPFVKISALPNEFDVGKIMKEMEGEFNNSEEVQKQQRECCEKLPNPLKRFVITPSDEGAANHCILENRSVMSQVVFDWLDDVFEK